MQPSERPAGMCVGESGCLAPGWEGVRLRGSGEGPASVASLTTCPPEGAPVTWCAGLALVGGIIWDTTGAPGGESSGTGGKYRNWCGRGRTCGDAEDGDLHGWTRVDVLPPDGMQEVSGSSPQRSNAWSSRFGGDHVHV